MGVDSGGDAEIVDGIAVDQVLLNDALEVLGSAGVIPDGIGVDHDDGPLQADAETISFATVDKALRTAEFEFLEAVFEKLPRFHALDRVTALGLGWSGAEEDMPLVSIETERLGGRRKRIRHGAGRHTSCSEDQGPAALLTKIRVLSQKNEHRAANQ